jgi:hypothetical protein
MKGHAPASERGNGSGFGPTPAGGHCEIIAAKRPFTACDKLAPPAVAQGKREMLLDISVEFLDDVFGRIACR